MRSTHLRSGRFGWPQLRDPLRLRLQRGWPSSLVTIRNGRRVDRGFPLDFQAKATINWELKDGCIVYDLEAKTYNDIVSRTEAETTLILILLCLPKEQVDWHIAGEDATTLRHCCYWHSFTGEVTQNKEKKRIFIPVENRLTPDVLNSLSHWRKQGVGIRYERRHYSPAWRFYGAIC